jgi:hypothetical protein
MVDSSLLVANLFCHGRLLYRFPGSDACRFSPRAAWNILDNVDLEEGVENILWDPFCGSGVIPSVGVFFFSSKFQRIVASDINQEAVDCICKNFELLTNTEVAEKRLKQMRGLMKRNVKSKKRWAEVADFLESLLPVIGGEKFSNTETFCSSAFEIPSHYEGKVHFVSDLPYGKASHLLGGAGFKELLEYLQEKYPNSSSTFVLPLEEIPEKLNYSEIIPYHGGRVIIKFRK